MRRPKLSINAPAMGSLYRRHSHESWFFDSERARKAAKSSFPLDPEIPMIALILFAAAATTTPTDHDVVAELDRTYQAAVKHNDAETMGRILHPEFQLVLGTGRRVSRAELLGQSRNR